MEMFEEIRREYADGESIAALARKTWNSSQDGAAGAGQRDPARG